MIDSVYNLSIKPRSVQLREDGSLPLDLWKTHSAKDTITIPRSDMIQHFANQLLHKADVDGSRFTIDKVREREREEEEKE